MSKLHLVVIDSDPVSEGPYGCDYTWSHNFAAYRCAPLRWCDDASYAEYQARDIDDSGEDYS